MPVDSYATEWGEEHRLSDIVVPYIKFDTIDAKAANAEIKKMYDESATKFKEESGPKIGGQVIDYTASEASGVVSIMIVTTNRGTDLPVYKYKAYNFDAKTGNSLVSYSGLLNKLDIKQEDVTAQISAKVKAYYTEIKKDDTPQSKVTSQTIEELTKEALDNYQKSMDQVKTVATIRNDGGLNVVVEYKIRHGFITDEGIIEISPTK